MKPNKFQVGRKINQIREKDTLTLEEFGERLGKELNTERVKEGIISRWENGISLPNSKRIKAIAKLGGISVEELLYGSVEEYLYKLADEKLNEVEALYFRRLSKQSFDDLVSDIKNEGVVLSDEKTVLKIMRNYIDRNKVEYLKSEEANIKFLINFLNDEGNKNKLDNHLKNKNENPLDPTLGFSFKNTDEYFNFIVENQENYDELAMKHSTTHKILKEIELIFNVSTFTKPIKTESITLQSFVKNKYQPTLRRDLSFDAIEKFGNKNIITTSNTHRNVSLTLYDEQSGKIYIVPDYKDGFLPIYDFCPYLIIQDNEIYTEYLINEKHVMLDNGKVNITDVDFIAPIISILF